jgi:hypothetical protein
MASGKHSKRLSIVPARPFRSVIAALGLSSLVATTVQSEPRYESVVKIVLACTLVAAGMTPAEYRVSGRRIVLGLMTVLLALAGVVASASMDEAMTLVSGGIVAGMLTCLFNAAPRRARHSAPSV